MEVVASIVLAGLVTALAVAFTMQRIRKYS